MTDPDIEAAVEAMLDAVEQENSAQGMFGGEIPREQYRPTFRRYVSAALDAAGLPRLRAELAQARAENAKLRGLLLMLYNEQGPGDGPGIVPPETFAAMSLFQIDAKWDFDGRHLMHEIAKALARAALTPESGT